MFVLTQKLEECQTDQLSYRTRPSCSRNTRLWLKVCDRGISPVFRNLPTEKLDRHWGNVTKVLEVKCWCTKFQLCWMPQSSLCQLVLCEVFPIWIYGHYSYDHGEKRSMNKFQRDYTHKTTMLVQVIKNSRQGADMLATEIALAFFTNCVILSHWKDLNNNCKYESQCKLNFLWREAVLCSVILYG